MLSAKFGWNWHRGSGEEDFLISSMYCRYFVIISHLKKKGSFIYINLNLLYQSMLCAKFGEKDENMKSWQTDGQTHEGTTGDQKNLGELKINSK